ncbi:spermidine synthase [Streptomyces sp. AJS327]|uniref:spermidine synthase n=1 Tax=Streptomyces sp. AJS327 TaxID=2545265 RepID=UPI0015DEA1FC|nr:spermidine synthase [Streptomyces sp. AJS327]MBA0051551.1 spermidine synthase [Streptomyces sp. AJS327]
MGYGPGAEPTVLDRRRGPHGEIVLRHRATGEPGPATAGGDRDGGDAAGLNGVYEIIANGCFLMDTSDGRSERLLVRSALAALPPDRAAPTLLIGGLGVGFSLAEAAAEPRWGTVAVVEREAAVLDWHAGERAPLAPLSRAALRDPRTTVLHADLVETVRRGVPASVDALCLDIDNGPEWTVTEDNGSLYSPAGLSACHALLTPGGVLAVWSARASADFERELRIAGFTSVRTEESPVARGVPDVVHFAVKPA